MYTDNTTLLSTYDTFHTNTDTDIATIQRNINEELLLVTTWLSRNKLLIITTKTKMTVFHTQQKHINLSYPDVIINNSHVESVDDFKLLGITVNKHLKWNTHIENTAIKVSKYIGVLNRLKHTLPPGIFYTLYNTLIIPHFNYGLILWGHHNTRLHKRAIRTITNSRHNSHTEPICKLLNIIELPYLYKHY